MSVRPLREVLAPMMLLDNLIREFDEDEHKVHGAFMMQSEMGSVKKE